MLLLCSRVFAITRMANVTAALREAVHYLGIAHCPDEAVRASLFAHPVDVIYGDPKKYLQTVIRLSNGNSSNFVVHLYFS